MALNHWISQHIPASRPATPKERPLSFSANSSSRSANSSARSFNSSSQSSNSSCWSLSNASPTLPPTRQFLDLPLEIRFIIYEAIFTPASVALQSGKNPGMIVKLQNFPDLITRGSRDVQLFRTCRAIHEEAAPIFYRSLNLLVYQHLPILRFDFLPRIGAYNASFIRRAIISPIGLSGEHHRFLECLGSKHGGLIGLDNLTLELWNLDHVPAFVNTCQELIRHHAKLKILFGRGLSSESQVHLGDIPSRLKLAKLGHEPGCREHVIHSIATVDPPPLPRAISERCRDESPDEGPLMSRGRRQVSLALPAPRRTILWAKSKDRFWRTRESRA